MTRWKKLVVAASTGAALLVLGTAVASASGAGQAALRSAGARAVLMAATSPGKAQPNGGVASGTGLGPIQITIGQTWTLQDQLIVRGTVIVTCGPFVQDGGTASVTVEEALSGKVGHANATILSLTCDGAPHAYQVAALVSDVPFQSQAGAVGVSAQASGVTTTGQFVGQQGSAVSAITVK